MRYRLAENKRTELPRHLVAVDTETVPVPHPHAEGTCTHRLMLGRAVYWRWDQGTVSRERWVSFRSARKFWEWAYDLARPKQTLWVWAHNAGFDLTTLRIWEEIECGQLRLRECASTSACGSGSGATSHVWSGAVCTEDPPFFIHARTAQGASVKFCDSLNWCLAKLEDIGRWVGLEKAPCPGELSTDLDWYEYCTRDVQILQRLVCRILEECRKNHLGNFRFTAPGQSMQLFRHLPRGCELTIDTRPGPKRLQREAYYGPKCEPRYAGAVIPAGAAGLEALAGVPRGYPTLAKGPVHCLDLNSAYPFVMRHNQFPIRLLSVHRDISPKLLRARMECLGAVARVKVDSGSLALPRRVKGRVVWMRGRFITTLCGPELIRALDFGSVMAIDEAQLFTLDRPFAAFVDHVLAWRQRARGEGDAFGAKLAKLIGNSLHGKFSQRAHRWEMRALVAAPGPWGVFHKRDPHTGRALTYRSVGWNVQEKMDGEEHPASFPALSAYTTCYHREHMQKAIFAAGERDVLYEDADTIHVTQAGLRALERLGWIDPEEPGKFRVEKSTDRVVYHGAKHYEWGGERVCAGLKAKGFVTAEGLWQQEHFLSTNAQLSVGMPIGPVSYEVQKELPGRDIPGRVAPDGWVYPLSAA